MVNAFTLNDQRKPQIGADDNGDFVVSWESTTQDGSVDGTFARRVSAAGAGFGPEFQVNSYTVDDQRQIFTIAVTNGQAVDFDADGDFVIAWTTEYQDGNSSAVFAQRFTLPPLATLDVDGNGLLDPLTDGLLILRDLFGFTGTSLTAAPSAPTARAATPPRSPTTSPDWAWCSTSTTTERSTPLTDGLLTLRFLFGFTGRR